MKLMRCPNFFTILGRSLSGRAPKEPVQKHKPLFGESTASKIYCASAYELEPGEDVRDSIRVRLRSRIKELVRKSVDSQVLTLLDQTIKECEEIGPLVDSIAYHFLSSPVEKQRLLEVPDAESRERLLIETLRRQRYGLDPMTEFDLPRESDQP